MDLPERPDPTAQAFLRLIPKYGEVLAKWREETYLRDRERIEQMSAAAAEAVPLEDLLSRLQEDEHLSDMFRDAVDAAMRTGEADKLRLLGRALANGALARDQASADNAQQLLRTARELDPVDIRSLLVLQRHGMSQPWVTLKKHLKMSDAVADTVMARLQRLGLIEVQREAQITDPEDRKYGEVDLDETYSMTSACGAVLMALKRKAR